MGDAPGPPMWLFVSVLVSACWLLRRTLPAKRK